MKTNCWLILGTMFATSVVAQVNTNKLPEIPPPASVAPAVPPPVTTPAVTSTNAPAKKSGKAVKAKKKAVKSKTSAKTPAKAAAKAAAKAPAVKATEMSSGPVTLVAGPATVVAENVNLRGQAGLKGEVVGHVKKGDTVTVQSEITVDKPKAGEPAQWAKIALPSGTKVWVDAKYVDATNNVVTAKKLNLRGGPGENYSVLGVIEKGATITAVTTKGDWMEIQTPPSAFAFVAAGYLKQEAGMESTVTPPVVATAENVPPPPAAVTPPPAPPVVPPAMPPTPTTVAEAPPIAPPTATPPTPEAPATVTPPAPATPPVPVTPTPAPEIAATTPATATALLPSPTLAPEETDTNLPPPPPRIVTHEGSVRHSVSLVAPTDYELFDPVNNKAINYLHSSSTNLNLGRYNGMHITVTGEEGMDVRWADTPVLTIQKILVLPNDVTPPTPVLKPIKSRK